MPVGELLARFTSAELSELMAFYDLRANPPKPKQTPQQAKSVLSAMASKRPAR
jgi:hypothetical protein